MRLFKRSKPSHHVIRKFLSILLVCVLRSYIHARAPPFSSKLSSYLLPRMAKLAKITCFSCLSPAFLNVLLHVRSDLLWNQRVENALSMAFEEIKCKGGLGNYKVIHKLRCIYYSYACWNELWIGAGLCYRSWVLSSETVLSVYVCAWF